MSKVSERFFVFIFSLIIIMNSQFFFIPQIFMIFEKINTYHNKFMIAILCIILFIVWLVENFNHIRFNRIDLIVLIYLLFTSILLWLQLLLNNDNNTDIVSNYYYNLILLLYFPLSNFMNKSKEKSDFVFNLIISIGIIYLIATIFNYFKVVNGINISEISEVTLVQYVNGNLRLPQTSDFIGITILIILIKMNQNIIEKKEFSFYILLIIIALYTLLFISDVRMVFLTCVILVIYSLLKLLLNKFNLLAKIIIWMLFFVVVSFSIYRLELFQVLIGDGQKSASVFYRFEVIGYYVNYFFDNLIFGFGYSESVKSIYSITDIGMLGFIFKYGLIGLIWTVLLFIYLFFKSIKTNTSSIDLILIYLLITSISLSLFDSQRMLYFPILLSIVNSFKRGSKYEEV
ncbi:hypothetical protein [Enterococcus saccharolyticus]|uniref:hypothetical protein n=1 Tax=Enterococcus saccharolyticus TaxID=41997 RepID=UPI0039E0D865